MAKADVINIQGEKVGEVDLNESIWSADIKPYLIHDVVVMQLNNRRRGTSSAKTRGEVRGGGRETLEAEGYRPGEVGKHHIAGVGRGWSGLSSETEGIPHVCSEKGKEGGSAVGFECTQ